MRFEKLLAGWTFRTSTPSYRAGDELTAFVTEVNGSGPVVRIGDTELTLIDGESLVDGNGTGSLEDRQVRLRVASFDEKTYTGAAELLELLGADE